MVKNYIMYVTKYILSPDNNMCYKQEGIGDWGLRENGVIDELSDEESRQVFLEIRQEERSGAIWERYHSAKWNMGKNTNTVTMVRGDYVTAFENKRARGRSSIVIMKRMSEEILKNKTEQSMRVITIKANGVYEAENIRKGPEFLQNVVGGEIEGLTFAGHTDFIVFLNEHGKIDNLEVNAQAILFCLDFVTEIDLIRGNVVICGLDEEGSSCSLTDEQIDRFLTILRENPAS